MFLDVDHISIGGKTDPEINFSAFLDRIDIDITSLHVEFLQDIKVARDKLRIIFNHKRETLRNFEKIETA